jgi:hypothetical protein
VFTIDEELKAFLQSGVAAFVASASVGGRPHTVIAWGPRVSGEARINVFIEDARVRTTLANVQNGGQVALTVGSPVSYRSVQFKGRCVGVGPANATDEAWVQRHRDAFMSETSLVGDPLPTIRNLWMEGPLTRIEFVVERAFDQTPGPEAGREL